MENSTGNRNGQIKLATITFPRMKIVAATYLVTINYFSKLNLNSSTFLFEILKNSFLEFIQKRFG